MADFFGLDIGSFSIKAVQARKRGKVFRLETLGEIRTPANLNSQAVTDKRAIAEAIKKLVWDAKISTREVVLSLSEANVFTQVVEMPYLSEMELASAINFEAEQYVPVPLEEVKLEYVVLSTPLRGEKERKMEVLLIAAKNTAISQTTELIDLVGIKALALETETLSLVRVVNLVFKGNCLLLNLGHSASNIFILQEGKLRVVRTLNTAGEAFSRTVARELNMELFQAEQYKTAYGLDKSALEGKVVKAIWPIFNVLILEMRKALSYFYQRYPEAKITTMFVAGGGASLPGINSLLAETLSLEVVTFDPFKVFEPEDRLSKIKDRAKYATAIGLAIREE